VAEGAELRKSHHHSRSKPETKEQATKPGPFARAIPSKNPTFLASPGLKEQCRRLSAARAGRRGVERDTANHFNPKRIIVKLRNIEKNEDRSGKIEGRRGLDVRAALEEN
jgi:hypothetical protein